MSQPTGQDFLPADLPLDATSLRWRSASLDNGTCVEVAGDGDDVLIRDSKGRGVIATSRAEWDAFLNGCKGGVFDGI